MADSFVPKKFYVSRKQTSVECTQGFMTPMQSDGFTNRKKSADKWAAGSQKIDPIEVPNDPFSGYVIMDHTRRYRTDNVVWRVLHPMGFEFEITSDNFSEILFDICLNQGTIETEMQFVRCGGANLLYPVHSKQFKAAQSEDAYFKKVGRKDLEIGSVVTLVGSDQKLTYLGTYHQFPYDTICPQAFSHDSNIKYEFTRVNSGKVKSTRMAFFAPVSNTPMGLQTYSSPKVNVVVSAPETPMTEAEALAIIAKYNSKYGSIQFAYVGPKLMTLDKMKVRWDIREHNSDDYCQGYNLSGFLRKVGTEEVVCFETDIYCNLQIKDTFQQDCVPGLGITIRKQVRVAGTNGYWGNRYNTESVILSSSTLVDPNAALRPAGSSTYWYPDMTQRKAAHDGFVQQIKDLGYEFVIQQIEPK